MQVIEADYLKTVSTNQMLRLYGHTRTMLSFLSSFVQAFKQCHGISLNLQSGLTDMS